jgi:hypothetical protein
LRFSACGTFSIYTIAHKHARTYINIVVFLNRQYIHDLVFGGVRNAHPFTYTCLSVTWERSVVFFGFPTDKTDLQDITEILLKVAFKHCNPIHRCSHWPLHIVISPKCVVPKSRSVIKSQSFAQSEIKLLSIAL